MKQRYFILLWTTASIFIKIYAFHLDLIFYQIMSLFAMMFLGWFFA